MAGLYAEGTTVSAERSQAEIQQLLSRYKASAFMSGFEHDRDGEKAMIAFRAHDRTIRFVLRLPGEHEFARTETGRERKRDAQRTAYQAEVRRRWRSLALAIKAKLEAVETGIASFEGEFLAYVLPDNTTVAESLQPRIRDAIERGVMPTRLLPQIERGS